jgi:hypothetical protein
LQVFQELAIPSDREKTLRKTTKVIGGVRFNPKVLQVSRFSKGDKARVSLDMEFSLFKQALDKGIGG